MEYPEIHKWPAIKLACNLAKGSKVECATAGFFPPLSKGEIITAVVNGVPMSLRVLEVEVYSFGGRAVFEAIEEVEFCPELVRRTRAIP